MVKIISKAVSYTHLDVYKRQSLSQSKTHLNVSDEISSDDIAYVLEILNFELLPRLEKRGYSVKNGFFVFPEKDNLTLKDKLAIAKDVDLSLIHI